MNYRVHIKIADRGWILEKCASEIARRAPNVTFGEAADPSADIQYYVNYSARTGRVSPVEIAFFTHSEEDANARRRYFATASEVESAVCMSKRYADELAEAGIRSIETISPGVDLALFRPKVKIGVVGRTYHTGRKGEALVAGVMDIEGIEWKFTGKGWPGESIQIPETSMPGFYNGVDYLLIPSYFEGGPMSVLEALACGVPIISSDVGWVNEFPHIPFENGSVDSLRAVLQGLVADREKLRRAVEARTWEAWADGHLALFDRLAPKKTSVRNLKKAEPPVRAVLMTHGTEGVLLGGPTVRVPQTATALARHNVSASMPFESADNYPSADIVHVFNAWPPDSALTTLMAAREAGKPTVLSPIFLNLSTTQLFNREVPKLFEQGTSASGIDAGLQQIATKVANKPNDPWPESHPGHYSRVRAAVAAADSVILLSEYERQQLATIGADLSAASVVHNAVDTNRYARADGELFAKTYGVRDYVLCVGRIESRKNQLLVAYAAKELGLPVVFIGHDAAPRYAGLVRQNADSNAIFIPRLDHENPLLDSAYAGAAVFCLPSWAEGAPLAAMEAAAAGTPLVMSDRSGEAEYFGGFAEYVNPADLGGLKKALLDAVAKRGDLDRRRALQVHMAQNFSWDNSSKRTADVYRATLAARPPDVRAPVSRAPGKIFLDLTTTYHFRGTPTGIARLERDVYEALVSEVPDRVVPTVWNSRSTNYLRLPVGTSLQSATMDQLHAMEADGTAVPLATSDIPPGSQLLMVGGAWIRNGKFATTISAIKAQIGLRLTVLFHDLIQMKFKAVYPEGAGDEFERHARMVAKVADSFLVYSESTRRDLHALLQVTGAVFRKIVKFRMGSTMDEVARLPAGGAGPTAQIDRLRGKRYALFVSSIDPRKNHILLVNVWRRLIEERGHGAPHLVFVGRPFWKGEELVEAVKRDPILSRHIHILSDVGDEDLDWCYRNATLTLYPSLYEGWGLPIEESLTYGKFCIASDASSTREVAPNLTDLLDPYDFRAWLNRIALYFDNPTALAAKEAKIRAEYVPYSWASAVGDIVDKLDAHPWFRSVLAPILPHSGLTYGGDAETPVARSILGLGWGPAETNGRRMTGDRAELRFTYLGTGDSFWVRASLPLKSAGTEGSRSIWLSIDGQPLQQINATSRDTFDFRVDRRGRPLEPTHVSIESNGTALSIASLALTDTQAELDHFSEIPQPAAPKPDISRSATVTAPLAVKPSLPTTPINGPDLHRAMQLLKTPGHLPDRYWAFRLVRFIGLEPLVLRIYSRIVRRPNEATRIILKQLLAQQRLIAGDKKK